MDPVIAIVAVLVGYLLGSISFTRIVARLAAPDADLSEEIVIQTLDESRPVRLDFVSATTLGKRAGARTGATAGILDVLKVLAPALAFRFLAEPGRPYYLLAATAGMVGHIWPLYFRFRGGRGMSAAFGGFLAVDPIGALVAWILGTLLGMAVRDALVTFTGWLWLMIPWLWLRWGDWRLGVFALAINALFFLALVPEIRRHLRYRREEVFQSYEEQLQTLPMGRGLYKMGVSLRLLKKTPAKDDQGT